MSDEVKKLQHDIEILTKELIVKQKKVEMMRAGIHLVMRQMLMKGEDTPELKTAKLLYDMTREW